MGKLKDDFDATVSISILNASGVAKIFEWTVDPV
jgi:hypothetical protein